ncbi:unnamed protein product [Ranitomeya imitator]|uniref:Reverse transcriptase domain-containing protein n=1 Tax=Ranitomeya imitator TaxID=111125 RepID=A0ABN9MAA4_9NEOB|nr:unnamed protein product [Ranitomeya imitator]
MYGFDSTSSSMLELIPDNPQTDTFYMLPKIHKEGNPGRPIISGIGTLTENIAGWVVNIMKPLVRRKPSYIPDTMDILCKLSALGPLPEEMILATIDVESLYSNIPHEDGIAACKYFLQKNNLDTEQTLQFIRFVLHHNYFSFRNNLYQQYMGSTMGSKVSPQYANLFMAKLEELLSSCSVKPLAYFCYIDDLLIIWTGSKDDLLTFYNKFNKYHPTIKLTLDFLKIQIHFLDMTIYIKDNAMQTK